AGVRYLFGNPGTTELPFLDALADSGLEYVLGLQEATAVAAADGYAQAAGTIGVVNVHVAPGLANGLSILHSAARAKTPLLVTAGQQDTRFLIVAPSSSARGSTASPCTAASISRATMRSGVEGCSRHRPPSARHSTRATPS